MHTLTRSFIVVLAAVSPLALTGFIAGCDESDQNQAVRTPTTPPPAVDWQNAPKAPVPPMTPPKDALAASAAILGSSGLQAANSSSGEKQWASSPKMTIDPAKKYTATFVTSKGDIVVELFAKEAPITVNNLVFLAKQGFYDNVPFHRVLANFMIQGGDAVPGPGGPGTGGPGYKFADEVDPATNPHKFDHPGLLAMANSGPATNGSQFFITHVPTPWLNGKHTIFGNVSKGQDVVNAIQQGDVLKTVKVEEK